MADAVFNNYKNSLWGGGNHGAVDWDADDIRIIAVDHGTDTPAPTTDEDLADIIVGARVFVTTAITGVTIGVVSNGTVDHDNKLTATVTGASIESLVWYKHTGTESNSPTLVYVDSATGLPLTPNGGSVDIQINASGLIDH
jgi:hypothetical protein